MAASVRTFAWLAVWFALGCQFEHAEKGLSGRTFWLESAVGFSVVPGFAPPTLQFGSRQLVLSAGCDPHEVQYSLQGGRLVVDRQGAPSGDCVAPQLEDRDSGLMNIIASRPRMILEGARFTLIPPNTASPVLLTFVDSEVASPDPPLPATLWTIDTSVTDEGAINVSVDPPATMVFDEAGRVHIDTTCVVGEGLYALQDDSLVLAEVVYPAMACADEIGRLDTNIQQVMSNGFLTFEIAAGRLTLTRSQASLGAHAQ